eukprot:1152827-Pelagomonas_calceolata.AAC.2
MQLEYATLLTSWLSYKGALPRELTLQQRKRANAKTKEQHLLIQVVEGAVKGAQAPLQDRLQLEDDGAFPKHVEQETRRELFPPVPLTPSAMKLPEQLPQCAAPGVRTLELDTLIHDKTQALLAVPGPGMLEVAPGMNLPVMAAVCCYERAPSRALYWSAHACMFYSHMHLPAQALCFQCFECRPECTTEFSSLTLPNMLWNCVWKELYTT